MKTKIEETNEIIDVPATVEEDKLPVATDRIDSETIIHNIEAQDKIIEKLVEYMKHHLVEGQDYGTIPGVSKPSLWKSGAEKINFIFNLVPKFEILKAKEYEEEYSYKISCNLVNRNSGRFMGSGLGFCSSREKKYRSSDPVDIANTIIKMADKRAYIDATLKSTMASFLFTQDLEDGNVNGKDKPKGKSGSTGGSKKSYKKQELNPETFKMLGGKYKDKTLVQCPSWYIEGQIKWVTDGKSDPAKFGYDKDEYIKMFKDALGIKKEKKEGKGSTEYIEEKFDVLPDDIPE
ncbi:MAG: hypothetical protein H8E13_00860 [Actinobacteria bacterium]|nr:hypothetical protein [Actinomycetota bacterium]